MDRKCPDCASKMTMLFTSYVCDMCNPPGASKTQWNVGYVPVYKLDQKQVDGLYIEAVWPTLETAREGISSVYGYDESDERWTIIRVRSTRPLIMAEYNPDYLYRLTLNAGYVIRNEREPTYGIPYIHFVGEVK